MSKYYVLFPQWKDEPPVIQDVTKDIKRWERSVDKVLKAQSGLSTGTTFAIRGVQLSHQVGSYLMDWPRDLSDRIKDRGRKGYLKYRNEWFVYKSSFRNSIMEWRLVGHKAKKIPPYVIELLIETTEAELPSLLLDPNPMIRSATKKYCKRSNKISPSS